MSTALLVIDAQNDYYADGAYPLWNMPEATQKVCEAITRAKDAGVHIVYVQHVADPDAGPSPFFNDGTPGAQIHPDVKAAAPDAPVVVKRYADAFEQTTLAEELTRHGVTRLLLVGMMTQNCVTHTAISKAAEAYDVTVLTDACTTVDEMIHGIALHALSTRVRLTSVAEAFAES